MYLAVACGYNCQSFLSIKMNQFLIEALLRMSHFKQFKLYCCYTKIANIIAIIILWIKTGKILARKGQQTIHLFQIRYGHINKHT